MDFNAYGELFASSVFGITSFSTVLTLAFSIVAYIFSSLALYQIAKRRGIRGAGWAWVPLGNLWILGCIADQYDYTVKDVRHKQRHLMLWLYIALFVLYIAVFILLFFIGFRAIGYYYNDSYINDLIGLTVTMLILCIILLAIAVLCIVFVNIVYHKVYKSCRPAQATLFTVLTIIFSFLAPFFLFACRKKDDGMVPPAPAAPYTPPVYPDQSFYPGNNLPQV